MDIVVDIKNLTVKYKILKKKKLKEKLLKWNNKEEENFYLALNSISFQIRKGDIVGIIGGNGAGKSTLLKAIAGIFKPDEGDIINNSSSTSLLALGVGFQNELSGRDNIYLNGLLLGMSIKNINEKYEEIVEFSEIKDFIDNPIKTYSSGMKSKLAFSIVTSVEPDLLLIDEIFSVGDAKFKIKSNKKIRELIKGERTVVIVSHSLGILKELCNKILWLEKGNLKLYGLTSEVLKEYQKYVDQA